jgi:ATP-binding cassette subfamily F protein 3
MLINANGMCFGYAGETLLENITFTLNEGDRVGLIGANGEGKTTLIRLMLGELEHEKGELFLKSGARIGYLAQNGGYDSYNTVWQEMQEIFAEDKRLLSALRDVENEIAKTEESHPEYARLAARYESLNKQIAARDSYHFEVKIRTVLGGMGFANRTEQVIHTMSGGEKTRLKLCRLLLEEPELLILDEPTNHLDVKTLFWLEEYLAAYKGAIFTVSHDRYFLDKTVRQIYEIENKKLYVYKGNYTKFKTLKAERVAHQMKEYEKQQVERAHMQEYVDRNLVRASTTKSAQSRRHKLEIMELIEKPTPPPTPPRFSFSYAERPYEQVLSVSGLRLFAGEKLLLENAEISVVRGEKCAIVGDNGTGKTTLLKAIAAGKDPAIKLGRFVRLSVYDQENANLNPENTVLQELWERHVSWDQTKVRNILAQAKLEAEDMDKKVRMLSGGERAKLALAVFSTENGNVLLLDEPTNHLDLPARESLEAALKVFDGTVLFVSHDRYFIEALAGKIFELENGKIHAYACSYNEYSEKKREEKALAELAQKAVQSVPAPTKSVEQPIYKSKEERKNETKRRIRAKEVEAEIERLEEENEMLGEEISSPEVASNFALLTEKCNRMNEIKDRLDELYAEYENLV